MKRVPGVPNHEKILDMPPGTHGVIVNPHSQILMWPIIVVDPIEEDGELKPRIVPLAGDEDGMRRGHVVTMRPDQKAYFYNSELAPAK